MFVEGIACAKAAVDVSEIRIAGPTRAINFICSPQGRSPRESRTLEQGDPAQRIASEDSRHS